jgi:hypothetical protein
MRIHDLKQSLHHDPMMSMSHWGMYPVGFMVAVNDIMPGAYRAVYVPVDEDGQPLNTSIYQHLNFGKLS